MSVPDRLSAAALLGGMPPLLREPVPTLRGAGARLVERVRGADRWAWLALALLAAAIVMQSIAVAVHIGEAVGKPGLEYRLRRAVMYGLVLIPLAYYLYARLERWLLDVRPGPRYRLHFAGFALAIAAACLLRVLFAVGILPGEHVTLFSYDAGWAAYPKQFPLLDLPTVVLLALFRLGTLLLSGQFDAARFFADRSTRQALVLLFLWWVSLYAYMLTFHHGDFAPFTGRKTLDLTAYKKISDALVRLEAYRGFFQIGYPLFMAPFNLFAGTFTRAGGMETVSHLNAVLFLAVAFGVMGAMVVLLTAGLRNLTGPKGETWGGWLWLGLLVIVGLYAYGSFPPPYASRDNKGIQDITVGIVGGVEPFNALLIALAIYVLSRPGRFSPWVGVVGALLVMTKESNVLIFALFLGFWFLSPGGRGHAFRTGLIALAVFSIQLGYNLWAFGGGLLPHRVYQSSIYAPRYARMMERIYGIKNAAPSKVSVDFAIANLPQMLSFYGWVLVVLAACLALLLWRRRERWQVWCFAFGTLVVFFLFHSGVGRFAATFRYLHVMAPLGATLLGPAVLLLVQMGRERWQGSGGGVSPPPAPAPQPRRPRR